MEEVELGGLEDDDQDDDGLGIVGPGDEEHRFSYLGGSLEVNFLSYQFVVNTCLQ